ncbi:hypothetical protein B0J17DRAFT_711219 [Rhizoctonia solani]|nr:hypothetical protein B0J17DRAFT_711219 [Rhizoctonia solani]
MQTVVKHRKVYVFDSDELEVAIQNMTRSPEIENSLVFSSHVSRVVQVQSQCATQGLDCDAILGWRPSDERSLISREHAKTLVEMLGGSNQHFEGLLFLLWCYIYLDVYRRSPPAPDIQLVRRITEIHFRYQGGPLLELGDELCGLIGVTPGEVSNMGFGLERLLPSVFGVTIQRFWSALTEKEEPHTMLLGSVGMMLVHFKSLWQANSQASVLSQPVQKDILDSFTENDLLDLVATTMFRFDPNADERTPNFGGTIIFVGQGRSRASPPIRYELQRIKIDSDDF